MKDRLFVFGTAITAFWFVFTVYLGLSTTGTAVPQKLNEWGDFLAGFAAPMAFLWLVLGFIQQGKELRVSTRALQLQAEELRNSVEQQRQLVEVTRQQVDAAIEDMREQRRKEFDAAQPRFVFQPSGSRTTGGAPTIYQFEMHNEGGSVSEVRVMMEPTPERPPLNDYYAAIGVGKFPRALDFHGLDEAMTVTFLYTDRLGNRGSQRFYASRLGARASVERVRSEEEANEE